MQAVGPGTIAIVTGGASGIGRAISAALVGRGVTVAVADLDTAGAERAATAMAGAGTAYGVPLDVTDAEAVQTVYGKVHDEHGRLDLVVNNAGIATAGAFDELTLDHWNATIDVNLRGVVHGVHAAYPIMIAQGSGHILNTASLAGLLPTPLMAPYTATKHAIVALTLALRAEAAPYGVQASALCPGFVDTPLLDHGNPDLPQTRAATDARQTAQRLQRRLYSPEMLAHDVLRGLDRNTALIVEPAFARLAWRLTRLAPKLLVSVGSRVEVRRYLRERKR
jgi:NAD(P)-dependent dehydrogenase (short-subunit alcohol dehydrogenase family)